MLDTLSEAFYHYPVLRYVIGGNVADFDEQFRRLIRMFVMARVLSDEPLLGIGEDTYMYASAAATPAANSPRCCRCGFPAWEHGTVGGTRGLRSPVTARIDLGPVQWLL